jgi:DNA repair exonuclease SbcCD nuclease subunit
MTWGGSRAGGRAVVLVHSSDLHIDDGAEPGRYHGLEGLRFVLKAAHDANADAVLLAGDTFDNGRVSEAVARQAGSMLDEARVPVIVLPGNHDPAMPDGIFHRTRIAGAGRAMVMGHTHDEAIRLPHLDLEVLGRAHRSYRDMPPLPVVAKRTTRWQIIIAHGHYVPAEDWESEAHRSWRISAADLSATGVDYIALGHWDRPTSVGNGAVRAYYSGAPDLAQTVNVIRLDPDAGVSVERRPLGMPYPRRW